MFDICLFDLDQTLVDSEDMKELRESGKNRTDAAYLKSVTTAFESKADRTIYSEKMLAAIRNQHREMKMCVFTRAPRSYTLTILQLAYPSFEWDLVVAYEDVERTKPFGDGIDVAMKKFDVEYLNKVVLVGDSDVDIRSAYHAGCVAILDKSAWPNKRSTDHWRALSHVPDVIVDSYDELLAALKSYEPFLPELERLLSGNDKSPPAVRFDRVNKFIPGELGGDSTAYPIHTGGRSFSGYKSLQWRRRWHLLSESIAENKNVTSFPDEWVAAVRSFIRHEYAAQFLFGGNLVVCVIPHRPGRTPRLEAFLAQLQADFASKPSKGKLILHFRSDVLGFKDGVRSQSNDKLDQSQRFANVRDHLHVRDVELAKKGTSFLVIDDVSTTGSTLIYAKKYLMEVGAGSVTCFTIAVNISKVVDD